MNRILLLLILAWTPQLWASSSNNLPPRYWSKGSWGFATSTEYFQTQANYDDVRGSYTRLAGENRLSSFETDLRLRYGFNRLFSFFTGFGFTQVRVVETTLEKSNIGLTDGYFGGNFLLWRKWIRILPEFQFGFPFSPVEKNQREPMIHDGSIYARAGLHLIKDYKFLSSYGYVGMHAPFKGLAKRFEYSADLEMTFRKRFGIFGGIYGYEPVLNDELTYEERTQTATSANGGSFRFNAWDPALLSARAGIVIKPDRQFHIRAAYSKTLDGVRSAEGQSIVLYLSFNQLPYREITAETERRELLQQKKKNALDGFKVEKENADPTLFEPDDSSVQPTLNNIEQRLENQAEEGESEDDE